MRLVTSRPFFLGVLPQKKNYRKALAFSESPKRAESVWVATLMVSLSAQGEAIAGCNRTRNCLKKWGRFPTKLWYFGTTYFHQRCLLRPLDHLDRQLRFFLETGWDYGNRKKGSAFSDTNHIEKWCKFIECHCFPSNLLHLKPWQKLLAPKNLKASKTKHKRASRLIPGVRSLVVKLSLFHSSTTVARGTSQIITGIPDSHHGCFVITPLIRLPN